MKDDLKEMIISTAIAIGLSVFLGALAFLAWGFLAPEVHAGDRRSLRAHCAFDFENLGTCRRKYRPRHYHYHNPRRVTTYYETRDYRDREAYDSSPRCKARLSREGLEKYDVKEAKESAQSMAMEAIRNHHGVKYMDPANWEHVEFACGVSSTGNRGSEKTAELAGRTLKQCTVYLRPCRSRLEREDR